MTKFLLLIVLLTPRPLFATLDADAEGSQWTPPPVETPSGGTSEGDYADPDRRRMDEERRKNVLDQLCRKIKLDRDFDIGGGDYPTGTIGMNRRMEADIDGSLALIDEESLAVNWGRGVSRALEGSSLSGSLWVGAGVSGKSMVIRRLGSFNTCGEIKRLIDITDVKTFLPVNAKRIAAMGKGELWRVPLTIHIGYGASFSDVLGAEQLSVSIGASKSKNGSASMTLWRLSEKEARFRFRIDFIEVHSKSLNIRKSFTPLEFASFGEGFILEFINDQANRELRKYVSASLSWGRAKSDGKRVILEYTIDPTDPEQAEAMAQAIRGNLKVLMKLARKLATSKSSDAEIRSAYEDVGEKNTDRLGDPGYAALSEYGARSKSFAINVPFLFRYNSSDSLGRDHVTRYTGEKGEFFFFNASRSPNAEYFQLPFLGSFVKDLEHRNVDAITYQSQGSKTEDPIAVYIHNQGMLRVPRSSVEDAIEDANSILRLAGAARSEGAKEGMEIPVKTFLPVLESVKGSGSHLKPGETEPSDQKGWLSFTLVMNQRAVKDALAASSGEVLKAFARSMTGDERDMVEWLIKNGKLKKKRFEYDSTRAKTDLKLNNSEDSWMRNLSEKAAGLVRDIAEASAETDPVARAEKFAKVFSHKNRSGLEHGDVMRVLVQFADPLDLTGDFVSAIEGLWGAPDAKAHYVLKKDRSEVPLLGKAGKTRSRFVDGSILTD